jgi:hypothetical protein
VKRLHGDDNDMGATPKKLVAKENKFEIYLKTTKHKTELIAAYNDIGEYHLMLFDDIVYCFIANANNRLIFEMEMPSPDDQELVKHMMLNVKSKKDFTQLLQWLLLNYEWFKGMKERDFVETLKNIGIKPYQALRKDLDIADKL